jgi:hypothetical protein
LSKKLYAYVMNRIPVEFNSEEEERLTGLPA